MSILENSPDIIEGGLMIDAGVNGLSVLINPWLVAGVIRYICDMSPHPSDDLLWNPVSPAGVLLLRPVVSWKSKTTQ